MRHLRLLCIIGAAFAIEKPPELMAELHAADTELMAELDKDGDGMLGMCLLIPTVWVD